MSNEETSTSQHDKHVLDFLIFVLSLGAVLWILAYAIFLWEDPARLTLIFLPWCIILWALRCAKSETIIPGGGSRWNVAASLAFIAASLVISAYFFLQYHALMDRAGHYMPADFVLGAIAIAIIVFATWKTTGVAVPAVVLFFLFYAAFGRFFPGVFHHFGLSWKRILMISALELEGVFGYMPVMGFTQVGIFLIFAGMLQSFNGLEFLQNFAYMALRKHKWGLPQIAILSSLTFGMFSGSASANVAAVGAVNIPLMKRFGIKATTAGAIESLGSTGGQVMPPVMGVTAFLMADFLGVRYADIVIMGFPPAFIYYMIVAFSVYLATRRTLAHLGWGPEAAPRDLTGFRWFDGIPILVSIIALMILMENFRMSVLLSGMWMIATFLVTRFLVDLAYSKGSLSFLKQYPSRIRDGLMNGMASTIDIMLLLSAMGIIARVLVTTGLGQKISFLMLTFSGGSFWMLLLMILIITQLFGMAVSTVVDYLLVIFIAAPALLQFGIPLPVTHFMIFYLVILAALTPPVAMAVAVASSIAKASFIRTGLEAVKIGATLFLLPFLFIWIPGIIAANWSTPLAFVSIILVTLPLSYGILGDFRGVVGNLFRMVFLVLPIVGVLHPLSMVRWSCLLITGLLTFYSVMKTRPSDIVVSKTEAVAESDPR